MLKFAESIFWVVGGTCWIYLGWKQEPNYTDKLFIAAGLTLFGIMSILNAVKLWTARREIEQTSVADRDAC